MELTKEQLFQIENYLKICGVKYEDVKKELLDHFASILEIKLQENPKLHFQEELQQIHKDFGENGFKTLLDEKTTSVTKKFYKQSWLELQSFFTIPKITISSFLFLGLWQLINFTDNKQNFFNILSGILIFLGFRLLFLVNIRNSKKDNFLSLDITMSFFNSFYVGVMIFNFLVRFEKKAFLNLWYIYMLLIAFFLLILFYWCGEYVYFKNKKKVKQHYPNANIS
jgi:hypothetical protein